MDEIAFGKPISAGSVYSLNVDPSWSPSRGGKKYKYVVVTKNGTVRPVRIHRKTVVGTILNWLGSDGQPVKGQKHIKVVMLI